MSPRLALILRRTLHYTYDLVGAVVIVMCLAALTFRFWVMPDIERFRPDIERVASQAVGYPVRVEHLAADWYGVKPRVTLSGVRVLTGGEQALVLPKVEAVASWLSLAVLDLRLARLSIEGAQLDIRRDPAGVITLSGLPVNQPGAPSPFPDWLLRQPRVLVKDARITWRDDKLDAPELRFERVMVQLEGWFGRHRFGAVATPSAAAARRLDVRGDLRGLSLHDPASWSGQIYARVDGARFESWGRWVPWAQESVKAGVGDLRFWLDLTQGQVRAVTGDAQLAGAAINIDKALPDLVFTRLAGRASWRHKGNDHSLMVERLRFQTPSATLSEPATVRVDLGLDGSGKVRRIGASARNLRLEAFTALTGTLPLPRRAHDLIEALRPRGLVESAEGHWIGPEDYAVRAQVREAGIQPYAAIPGFSGVSARVRADQTQGEAEISGRDMSLNLPRVFREALSFTRLDARVGWKAAADGLHLDLRAPQIVNTDLAAEAGGTLFLAKQGAPHIDLRAHLTRGAATAVHRYLPFAAVSEDAYQWLKRGLQGGHSDDTRLVLRGPLDRFPFVQGGGEFKVSVHMVDGILDYAPGWPRIEAVNGMLVFHDRAMTLSADSARILAARLGPVRAHIPDLHTSWDETVYVDGKASGETRTFLDFIRASPVDAHTGGFTAALRASGNAELDLSLVLPTRRIDDSTTRGVVTLRDNRLDAGDTLPELTALNGQISFTNHSIQGKALQTNVLGMAAQLDLSSQPGGQVRVQLAGRATPEALKPYLPTPLLPRLSGSATWRAEIAMNAGRASEISVQSDLAGLAVNLPTPLGKTAAQTVPLSLVKRTGSEGNVLTARYGEIASLRLPMGEPGAARVGVRIGPGEPPKAEGPGLWVTGQLRQLDLDAWRGLGPIEGNGGLPLRQASLTLGEVRAFNRRLHDTHVLLRPVARGWNIQLKGREAVGEVATLSLPEGLRVTGHFKTLSLPDAEPGPATPSVSAAPRPGDGLESLELNAAAFAWKGRDLGALRLNLRPEGPNYQIEHFSLTAPDGRLAASGQIAREARRPTRLTLESESDNLGQVLGRVGQAGVIKGGRMRVAGTLGWQGGIEDFSLATLAGDLQVSIKQGQFLKVDPGAAKLLGMLSLQSLPRRVTLDFRDVFSDGFGFDEIDGTVHLERGAAYFRELRMDGPAAKVRLSGVADLTHETQHLRVSVQPRIEDSVALAGALLGGPVVGVGAFIANKVLQNPIGQAARFEYQVTGTWSEPLVTKLKRPETTDSTLPSQ